MPPDRNLAGQRLMVGFDGTDLNDDLRYLIRELNIGGIILFRRNLESPQQIRTLCGNAQRYAAECGLLPLFIAVDQEGGCVSRLPEPFSQFAGNPSMRSEQDARRFAEVTGAELAAAGFNMNMAPVLDVAAADCDSVMAERAFGTDAGWVARMGSLVIEGLQHRHIMAVAKHFPGIGRTVLDSHFALPRLAADFNSLAGRDLPPFQKAIESSVEGMMLSHIIYEHLDPEWPASLSKRIANDLLRVRLRFEGVVITDDLDMDAIARHFELPTAIERIAAAGIDIALICHSMDKMQTAFEEMIKAFSGSENRRRLASASYGRILRLKRRYLLKP